jgi:hypothetical protein
VNLQHVKKIIGSTCTTIIGMQLGELCVDNVSQLVGKSVFSLSSSVVYVLGSSLSTSKPS